jgi:hypothetical protein
MRKQASLTPEIEQGERPVEQLLPATIGQSFHGFGVD